MRAPFSSTIIWLLGVYIHCTKTVSTVTLSLSFSAMDCSVKTIWITSTPSNSLKAESQPMWVLEPRKSDCFTFQVLRLIFMCTNMFCLQVRQKRMGVLPVWIRGVWERTDSALCIQSYFLFHSLQAMVCSNLQNYPCKLFWDVSACSWEFELALLKWFKL